MNLISFWFWCETELEGSCLGVARRLQNCSRCNGALCWWVFGMFGWVLFGFGFGHFWSILVGNGDADYGGGDIYGII